MTIRLSGFCRTPGTLPLAGTDGSQDSLLEEAGFEPWFSASAVNLSLNNRLSDQYTYWVNRVVPKTQKDERLQGLPPQRRDAGQSALFLFLLRCDAG
jgi:hypothetical protein